MKPLLLLSLLCAGLTISSCASQPRSAGLTLTRETDPKAACLVWAPLRFSRLHDTVETIAQAKRLNAAHDAYCGG